MYTIEKDGEVMSPRVEEFLEAVEARFHVPLGERVDLRVYAEKLARKAINFFAMDSGRDIGHAAIYVDRGASRAFLTSIAVRDEYRGAGVGTRLIESVACHCRQCCVHRLELEVHRKAQAAIDFYHNLGFRELATSDGDVLRMIRDL